jgi:hypothetical protein
MNTISRRLRRVEQRLKLDIETEVEAEATMQMQERIAAGRRRVAGESPIAITLRADIRAVSVVSGPTLCQNVVDILKAGRQHALIRYG